MKKKRGRTAYSEEFRREAVRLVEATPDQLVDIARALDVNPETLRNWRRSAAADGDGATAFFARDAR